MTKWRRVLVLATLAGAVLLAVVGLGNAGVER
jgi:hypothetical protein